MSAYRKKPVEVQAVRNDGKWAPIMEWFGSLTPSGGLAIPFPFGAVLPVTRNPDGTLNIRTPEGMMRADVGDWLIQGVRGEFYPCKNEIFEATYEPVGGVS